MTTRMARSSWGLDTARDGWRMYAECTPDTADWFEVKPGPVRLRPGLWVSLENSYALQLCAGCPVRAECEQDAVNGPTPQVSMIAGGRVFGRRVRRWEKVDAMAGSTP